MSNEITSLLQPSTPLSRASAPSRSGSQPAAATSSGQAPADRLSLTDSARLLQQAEAKPGGATDRRTGSGDVDMTYSRTGDGFTGKGRITTASGGELNRAVVMSFDPESQTVSRQVRLMGENGAEITRSTEITRSDKGIQAVTRRVGVQGNESVHETKVYFEPDSGAADRLPPEVDAQRPSPAMANMMNAFFTTSEMDGFDASADLNDDGVINFGDLAALRAIEAGGDSSQSEQLKQMVYSMQDSFFSSSDMEGFDASSDLNDDGMINFQDLALLRAKMEGA